MRRMTAVLIVLLATGVASVTAQAPEPHEFQALIGLARVERDGGDMAAARQYFDEARRVQPLNPGQLAEYFWVLVDLSPREAIEVGREVLNHDPANGKVRDRTITAAIVLHDEDTVAALAAEGRRLDPGSALWARRLAESAMRRGRAADAARQYAAAMTGTGAVVDDRAGLALALEAAGQDARAMEVWQSVPATARAAHPEWERSRLRVMADAASARVAADTLETWVTAHPADTAMRGLLVERWAAAGEPARALAAVGPLTSGPAAERWWRRAAQLARAAGNRRDAISAFARLAVAGTATAADLHDLVELLIENGEFDRAAGFLTPVVLAAGCDDASMGLVDRLPDPAATDLMFRAVERDTGACASHPRWMQRSVDRLEAAGRHADALKVLDAMPAPGRASIADRRLLGQLRLWTGDTAGAIAVLTPVVDAAPDNVAAREALVDALRASGRSYEAWSASRPLLDAAATSAAGTDRLLGLAHLALEADEPGMVGPVLARLDAAASDPIERTSLRAEAALALGRPADARRLLASVDPRALAPDAALALIDGTMAMDGPGAALGVAGVFTSGTPAWRDVLARRALLEAVVGDAQRFASLRAALGTLDRTAVPVLDAEVALAEERPHDALAVLRAIPEDQAEARTNDLLSTALAGTGNLSAARDRLAQLRHARPRFVPFAIREADLAWRAAPSAATLSAVLDLPARFPGDWNAVIEAALALETDSRPADALARLGGETHLADVPLAGRLVAARALRTLGQARDALALLDGVPAISGRAAVLHAQLLASVDGWPRANRAFAALAARASATPSVFLAWASAAPTPADRTPVLAGAAVRFPDDPDVLSALATARWQTGDRDGARQAAEHAVDCSTGPSNAWLVYIDATAATRSRADLDRVLQQFISTSADDAALVTGVAEHLAGLARAPDDPLLARSLDWLATAAPDASLADARDSRTRACPRGRAPIRRGPRDDRRCHRRAPGEPRGGKAARRRAVVGRAVRRIAGGLRRVPRRGATRHRGSPPAGACRRLVR